MNVAPVGNNPWYTQSTYQPSKDGSEALRKQFLTLAKNLHDGDMKTAKASMEELKAMGPHKDAGSPMLQALDKAIESGDVKAARGAFEVLLGKAAEAVEKNRKPSQETAQAAAPASVGAPSVRPVAVDSGKGLDLYA